jgi:hypothetical protein
MPEVSVQLSVYDNCAIPFIINALQASAEEYLTPQEIAELLKVSTDTVVRKFENRKGVLDLGSSESRFTRRYRVLRIPRRVFETYLIEASVA